MLLGHHSFANCNSNDLIAARCDELLSEINSEYRSKRASGRLGPIECLNVEIRDFAERFGNNVTWETQFKFLPLDPSQILLILPLRLSHKNTLHHQIPLLF